MNLRTTLSTSSAGLAVAALALTGSLAGATGASAAPAKSAVGAAAASSLTTTYLCSNSIVSDQSIETTFKAKLPKKVKKGSTVAPIPFAVHVVANPDLSNVIRILGITEISGKATGAKVTVGTTPVKVGKVTIPPTAVPDSGNVVLDGTGKSKAFKAGKPGRYDVLAPNDFTADLRNQDGDPLPGGALTCTLEEGAPDQIGTLTVVR